MSDEPNRDRPSVERALEGDEIRDDEVEETTHRTGEDQARRNREDEPPA